MAIFDLVTTISVTLLAAATTSSGLGELCLLVPAGTVAITDGYTSYSTAAEVAAALDATQLTAQAAADVGAALAQSGAPARVYVATYDDSTGTPDDAADVIIDAGIDVGVFVTKGSDDDVAAMGTWLASGDRRWRYFVFGQSTSATLITGSPTADLDACQLETMHLIYAAATSSAAAAAGARLAGYSLQVDGQTASAMHVSNVPASGLTSAEATFALANHVNFADTWITNGAQVTLRGASNYDGTDYTVAVSVLYLVRRLREAIQGMLGQLRALPSPMPFSVTGEAMLRGVCAGTLTDLWSVGHLQTGSIGTGSSKIDMSKGYEITTSRASGIVSAKIQVLVPGEADGISLPIFATEAA